MPDRKETLLDAAIQVLGDRGMRGLTHRAVDAEAGVAAGSTANYFPTRESLLEAIANRVSAMERGHFDEIAAEVCPATPADLGRAIAGFARDITGARRALTLSRYAILVEAGHNAKIRRQLAETGSRVNAWFANWLRLIGSADTDHDVHVLGNYLTGLMLHQLAIPDPGFDPADKITALLESLVQPAGTSVRNSARTAAGPSRPGAVPRDRHRAGGGCGPGTEEPMERSDAWAAIDDQRRALVHLLEDLSGQEWRRPSLCQGWTVRQVAAHLALQNTTWSAMPRAVLELIRHGGMNGAIHAMACRHAELPVEAIVGEIRDRIGVWRPLPAVTFRETAIDYLVHGLDIAVPLGRTLPMPPGLAVIAADRVWSSPRMFHARKRLAGYRLVADDTPWAAGQGHEISGPIGALLLLLTGRPAALPHLSGPGAANLRKLLTPSPAA